MKNKSGITLIALVITIIVLIILAGVAISLTLGENGLLTKAKQAKTDYNLAKEKEELELEITNIQIEIMSQENRTATLNDLYARIDKNKYTIELSFDPVATTANVNSTPTYSVVNKIGSMYYFTVDSKLVITDVETRGPKVSYITFSDITWNSGKASITLSTKEQGTIEYKIGETGIYQSGTTISNLSHGDTVYARINNSGEYTEEETKVIYDGTAPEEFTVTTSDVTYKSMKIKTTGTTDNQTGLASYTYVAETGGNIVQEITDQTITEYQITGLTDNTEYVVYMLAYDNAGNVRRSNEVTVKTLENIVYLYKDGVGSELVNLPSTFTGGSLVEKKSNYLVGTYNDNQTNNSSVSAFYMDNINVNQMNHIYVHFYDVSMSGSSTIYASLCTTFNSQYNFPNDCYLIDKVTGITVNNREYLLDLDVSQMSGTFKLFFGGATVNDYSYNYYDPDIGTISFKIDKIYYK